MQDNNLLNNKLKMTYIAQADFYGTGEGGGARVKNMINLFRRIGIEVNLISYSYNSDGFRIEKKKADNLNSMSIHTPKGISRFLKLFGIFPGFYYAWRSSKDSDLLFSDLITTMGSLPIVILGKLFNKPVILDYIDTQLTEIIPEFVDRYVARNADVIFAISYYLLKSAKEDYNCDNVFYIPNCIDTDTFKMDLNHRKEIRENFGIKDDETVIGYAGVFVYFEGVPILIKAFKNLKKKHKNIKLALMGDLDLKGKNRDDIPQIVKDMNLENNVILISKKPHEEVPKYLAAFDILCCPKIDCEINRAANPVKVPEYLSMGLPTVASAVGGIIDTIEDEVNGFLVKPGDVKDLEEKMEWIILNPECAKAIGENGRKTAIERYSFEAIEDTIRHAISDVIERRGTKKGD